MMKCYQRIGWSGLIRPQDRRSSNMSDGAIFSSREKLEEQSAKDGFHISRIDEIELDDDDPTIDFFLCDLDEQNRRLDLWDQRRRRLRATPSPPRSDTTGVGVNHPHPDGD
jgi:hypothetical protein